ncbi:iron-containing alcohol dehydrogenase [Campylobacter canadensis]|uniref:iron-containing alcohol dehydrogenase n=1 Tax=Campylobacter canadensis TaxID=449520 RepID=UPI001554C87D|nr:iron-containing alcohol dehydrogenase [Campylobacter canadensis]MBZ7995502.1 iron-containing alcohol dehydrogenase [Campylobacter canadensis]MBZ7997318.1 iron-containing alcohol dehydrogenase [Campylobacter canadensis]MBZ8000847.1 iron-containing alcohol dehydrogenase [Campylobacter canadensis]MBZ8002668.1 iron-containing alcohol dehydrogenase [Campylobacter canadensis]MBZ8003005.1 iron-containing alcohol dehydrogenase [Campylobacter canadensis]
MKENITFTNTYVDEDISLALKNKLKDYTNILIISGKTAYEKSKDKIDLRAKNADIFYVKECSYKINNDILSKLTCKYELVLAIGGGKALDCAKYIANKLKVKIISIPSIAATCAATSTLSVMYDDNGVFCDIVLYDDIDIECFIDLSIIKNSPTRYLIAGIGDTIAKCYEFNLKYEYAIKNNENIDYSNTLGKACVSLCKDLNLNFAQKALQDFNINLEFKQVVMSIILNTGLVSRIIKFDYNGALAHATCYAISIFPEIEKNFLHGELVAFGILVQLLLEDKLEEYEKLCKFYKEINLACKISDFIDINKFKEKINEVVDFILNTSDAKYLIKAGFNLNEERVKMALLK